MEASPKTGAEAAAGTSHQQQQQPVEDSVVVTGGEEDGGGGPGRLYQAYAQNELITERLKLLNYEAEFVPLNDSLKTVPRHYFVNSTNVGEQFHIFSCLCVWLIRKAAIEPTAEGSAALPQEFDDPNATIARILDALKAKAPEMSLPPPNKLKSGAGQHCLLVLLHLSELALEQQGFQFGIIQPAEEEPDENATEQQGQAEDPALLTTEQFEEEVEFAEDEDLPREETDDDFHLAGLTGGSEAAAQKELRAVVPNSGGPASLTQMEEELRRVLPQLKISVRAGAGGGPQQWRARAEQMRRLETGLAEQYAELRPFLARTGEEIGQQMERIGTREQHLNEQFAGLLNIYRNKQNELAAVSEQYRESSGTLNSRTDTLNALNEEIDQLKQQIEEQGMQNTSGAPILKIKQALSGLDKSCFVMRVQIAALEHTLMQTQLAERLQQSNGGGAAMLLDDELALFGGGGRNF